jgi:hypothetical protein
MLQEVESAAQLQVPANGAADPAFAEFVLELMNCFSYSWQDVDAAEAKLMAVAQQAVAAPSGNTAPAGDASIRTTVSTEDGPTAAMQAAAAQRWQHQFNAGLLRRRCRLSAALTSLQQGKAFANSGLQPAWAGMKQWIEQNLLGAGGSSSLQ